eukprot:6491229-Amphidinium_carterae.1
MGGKSCSCCAGPRGSCNKAASCQSSLQGRSTTANAPRPICGTPCAKMSSDICTDPPLSHRCKSRPPVDSDVFTHSCHLRVARALCAARSR